MTGRAVELRREKLHRLEEDTFDLLVIGGGINGAGIAREAALRGLRTVLVDKGDFASGTSSRSSKLIHGGFRYLETGDFRLVLEASHERDLLRRRLAPHLVRPQRFFFPVYEGGPITSWKLRAGLMLYDLLAAFHNIARHRMLGSAAARAVEPELRIEGLRDAALYHDCVTDDARLVLETVLGAEEAGATCLNYLSVESLDREAGRVAGARLRDRDGGSGGLRVRARVVVNAAGPWVDRIRILDEPTASPVLRVTKGVHLVLPRERVGNCNAVVLHTVRDGRIIFVIPWDEHTLVGTTDTDYEGLPDGVTVEEGDVDYLLETVNFYFPRSRLGPRDVVGSFAGLRPLVDGGRVQGPPSRVSREEAVFESRSGLISLAGGKLTTYRRVAVKVVERVARRLRERFGIETRRNSGTHSLPLPGGGSPPALAEAPAEIAELLLRRYGSRAAQILALLRTAPGLAAKLASGDGEVRAEVSFATDQEMALRVEDVLRRRTHVALKGADGGAGAADVTAALMGEALGWSRNVVERRAREYVESLPGPDRRWRRPA
jgi:glycerol-3-phosphate dehydrogenase